MHDHSGLQVQFVQERCRSFTNLAVAAVAATEAERAPSEAVAERCVIDPVELDELIENAVDGGPRQLRAARDLFQGEPCCAAVEGVENQRHPLDHRRRQILFGAERRSAEQWSWCR